jgi:hypothetical protein
LGLGHLVFRNMGRKGYRPLPLALLALDSRHGLQRLKRAGVTEAELSAKGLVKLLKKPLFGAL